MCVGDMTSCFGLDKKTLVGIDTVACSALSIIACVKKYSRKKICIYE